MYYNFNPAERKFDIKVFADSCMENLKTDLSVLFNNTEYKINIRIVETLYTIKKTKSKITIIEQPYERKIAEYTNYKGIFDIVNFLLNQFNWLSDRNSSEYNSNTIDNIINNPKENHIYLFCGYDFGYKIGVVDNKVILITPKGEKFQTKCDIDDTKDILQIVLDSAIKLDLYVNEKLPI